MERRGRMYPNEGFTDKVIEFLEGIEIKRDYEGQILGGCIHHTVTSDQLIKISELIPEENLEDRQNFSPRFRAFLEFAKKVPNAKFEIYIIVKRRFDERVTVEGVHVPNKVRNSPLFDLLEDARHGSDESMAWDDDSYRYWWD